MAFSASVTVWLLAAAANASGTSASDPDVSVGSILYAQVANDKIGAFRAGALCLPAGLMRWRDLALPDKTDLIAAINSRITEQAGSKNALLDDLFRHQPSTRYRVSVTIESIKLNLCGGGFGPIRLRVKGKGDIVVRWDTFDGATHTKTGSARYSLPLAVNGTDPRSDPTIIFDAVVNTASAYMAEPPF